MDIVDYNKKAWNNEVSKNNIWTLPVSKEIIDKARNNEFEIVLTPTKPVPEDWFPHPLKDKKILGLAAGGGQQGPVMAATGADITIFDNSPLQLEQDMRVAKENNLVLKTVEGDMADLSAFPDETFDFIFHPCSNCFVPDVKKVWKEAYRVLKKSGTMIAGFCDPINFAIDPELEEKGIIQLKYKIPYSDVESLTDEERRKYTDNNEPLVFGHSLDDQIGGQIDAGFVITGFYGDKWQDRTISKYINSFIATRALKI